MTMQFIVSSQKYVGLEGEICMRELNCTFLNRAVQITPVHQEMIKPKERWYVKVETPFLDEISRLSIIKLLGLNTYHTLIMKVKLERNEAFLEAINNSTQVIV